MTLHTFLLVLMVASALLAAWIVVRFPAVNPIHPHTITIALVGAAFVAVLIPHAIGVVGVPLGALAAIFLVALPGCTYLFLVAAWVMLFVKRAIDPHQRW
jgi:hypothetical protein